VCSHYHSVIIVHITEEVDSIQLAWIRVVTTCAVDVCIFTIISTFI